MFRLSVSLHSQIAFRAPASRLALLFWVWQALMCQRAGRPVMETRAVQTLVRTEEVNLSQALMILIVPEVTLRQKGHMLNKLVLEWIWRGAGVTSLCLYSMCLWRSPFYQNSFLSLTDDIPRSLSDEKPDIRGWTCLTSSRWIGHNYYARTFSFGFMPSSWQSKHRERRKWE